jgi:molecular chaperone DnaJ
MAQAQREWFEKDYYKILGVPETATPRDITRAYRKLAKQYHPDNNPGDGQAETRFKEVSAAYDVLGEADKRKEYDEVRRLGPVGGMFRGGGTGAGAEGATFTNIRVDDLTDLFGGLFGRGRGRGRRAGPQRGADIEAELHLSFVDAINGVTTTVNVTSDAACATCGGTGAAPGTSPVICSVCGGRGVLDEDQGLFSFSQPCRACGGTGMRIETPCPTCKGSGVEHRPRQVKVRVPPGVADGQRIRLKARGGVGFNGGPSGDLYVVVHVAPHELFGRKGKDLTLTVPITFAEAALGATVTVPTLEAPVSVKIPAGTRSGRTFRVRGRGAPSGSSRGDLLVTVEVAVPQTLSDAERQAIEKLAAAATESPRSHLGV